MARKRLNDLWYGAQRTWYEEGAAGFGQRLWRWLKGERRYYGQFSVVTPVPERKQSVAPAETVMVVQRASEPVVPLVSVLIPVYNALEYVRECVESLFSAASSNSFELILIDNASNKQTAAWLDEFTSAHPSVTLLRLNINSGYGAGMNVGAQYARGEFLLLSNSDVLFTDHSVDYMVEALRADQSIGVVSPVTNYVGEGPQNAPEAKDLASSEAQNFARSVRDRNTVIFPPERVAFFCVMIRRTIFRLLNGLAPDYQLGNYEDEDFCARLALIGLRPAIVERCFIYHYGSKTFATSTIDHTQLMVANKYVYHGRLAEQSTDDAMLALKTRFAPPTRPVTVTPRFSVIVRTRNRPNTLRNTLRSLAMQRYTDFETIVVNDGGEDVSALLSEFEPYFPIQYLSHDTPRQMSGASNAALDVVRGAYFIHLDDDDIVYPHHLESFAALTTRYPDALLCYSQYNRVLMQEENERLMPLERSYPAPWEFDADALLYSNFIVNHSALFHRGIVDLIGLYDPALEILQDWDYLIRASRKTTFIPVGRVTCEYRFYSGLGNSLTGRRERVMNEMLRIYEIYPTSNHAILAQRKLNERGQAMQLAYTRTLEKRVEEGLLTRVQANAAVLNRTMGFNIPAHLTPADLTVLAE